MRTIEELHAECGNAVRENPAGSIQVLAGELTEVVNAVMEELDSLPIDDVLREYTSAYMCACEHHVDSSLIVQSGKLLAMTNLLFGVEAVSPPVTTPRIERPDDVVPDTDN